MTELIPFPGFEDLKNEIEQLRVELSMLVLERDELRLVICKNLERKPTKKATRPAWR